MARFDRATSRAPQGATLTVESMSKREHRRGGEGIVGNRLDRREVSKRVPNASHRRWPNSYESIRALRMSDRKAMRKVSRATGQALALRRERHSDGQWRRSQSSQRNVIKPRDRSFGLGKAKWNRARVTGARLGRPRPTGKTILSTAHGEWNHEER